MMNTSPSALPQALRDRVDECGFFPELVEDSVSTALGDETVVDFLVQHEATVGPEGIIRHLTVLVLTPGRLIVSHTDEETDARGADTAVTTSESVPLWLLGVITVSRVLSHPERYGSAEASVVETWLTLTWDAVRRLQIVPAHCGDPSCTADHGFDGEAVGEDITIRMSPAADGAENVQRLVEFAGALQRLAHGPVPR
ncbi:hypothetical protein HMPREF0682_0238 [Propionibacterium acidifaciens F0233]|uniref:Phosphodiesterase n=2 Tax=Actinomycetota TaxID=201174 RepID=U2QFD7_9ACTN|nr:hypothetical protein HMPREF0682_0238 [Propionibacterium acidifaciens F0233]